MKPPSIRERPYGDGAEPGGPGGHGESRLRRMIAASWERSAACGLDQDRWRELPYDDGFDDDSRLVRAAAPVLDRLVTTIADTPNSVLLGGPDGRILRRWVGEKSLYNPLDRAYVAPGFGFHEEFAGTNGLGTALEESAPVTVRGEDHYAGFLRRFACVGVPIHKPITHGVEGVLDLTCLAGDFSPLMSPLLIEAVKHIETRLTQMSSPSEVALLEEFVRACRVHRGPVVALRPNMILTNPAAVQHLTPADQAVLWDVAGTLTAAGRSSGTVELAGGRFRLCCTPVEVSARRPAGVVLRLDAPQPPPVRGTAPATDRDTGARALPGRSPQWRRVVARVYALAGAGEPIAVTGEPGTGKLRLAERLCDPDGRRGPRVFDATSERLLPRVREALGRGDTVILRRIDDLPYDVLARFHTPAGPGRLIVTARTTASGELDRTLARFPHHVWIPPLRQRAEDIPDLVPALLAELTGNRTTQCSLAVVQALMRYPWPGNVAELRDVLAAALAGSAGRDIEIRHLPTSVLKRAPQRHLSPMEYSERTLIIETLDSVAGNRSEASRILGIGRATLYRKMRNLGITTDRELTR